MIRKLTLACIVFIIVTSIIRAQDQDECQLKLSIFNESVKAKKYDTAYEPWLFVQSQCPNLNLAIYSDGEKILEHYIETTEGEEKIKFINDLLLLWKNRSQYFSNKTPNGTYKAKACQLQYDYRDLLSKSENELYNCLNEAFKVDTETFTHPKNLYTYFSLMVNLYDAGEKSNVELFDTYDNIKDKIQIEIRNYSEKLNTLILKIDNGEQLSKKEKNNKKAYESYLKNYALIQNNIDAKLNIRAVCENLIPLYNKDFETSKNDAIWLKRAVSRMYHKACTEDPLYEKLVKQYDEVSPSADTKIYVATVLFKKGKNKEGFKYLEEGYKLEQDDYKKSNLAIRIGIIFKNKSQYSKARVYFLEALKLNPANGKPHLLIAKMYHDSAKNCGKDSFYQRSVFWLAAKEAKKASRVDPTLQKIVNQTVANYEAKAPTKQDIFIRDMAGKTIAIKCWINRTIVVPNL